MTTPATPATTPTDALPAVDLKTTVMSLLSKFGQSDAIDQYSAKLAERPAQNTLVILGLAALLFYQAERGTNPKVNTIYDALEYCSSSLSVGYTNIFPHTPIGKLVATLLMTYGPALSGAVLDGPKSARRDPAHDLTQQKILATLEQILVELRTKPAD
jgi:hypothetical protein